MIIEAKAPYGYTIFCDDIRQEINGKTTHVGVYTGEMSILGEARAIVPQLCALIVFRDVPESIFNQPLIFRLVMSTDKGEQVITEATFEAPADLKVEEPPKIGRPDGANFSEIRLQARISPFVVEESCLIKSRVYAGDDEILCGALRVLIVPPSEVPEGIVLQ